MARLTKLEREALGMAASEILAGDSEAFFNDGVARDDDERMTREERQRWSKAKRLAAALDSGSRKIAQGLPGD
jgi:hypothetical protein